MDINAISPWILLAITASIVMAAAECGYWLARFVQRRVRREKLPPVSSIVSSTLGLVAFLLAFTFGMAGGRFDARKGLVREEANIIRTAWLRSDLLPDPSRGEAKALIRTYLDKRIAVVQAGDLKIAESARIDAANMQHQLWGIAAANGRLDMHSPLAALYVESVNRVIDVHALRVITGLDARIPTGIWIVLYSLIIVGMIGVGYQAVIAEATSRSVAPLILAVAFSLVISLITSLDRPAGGFITVSQKPLQDVQVWMNHAGNGSPGSVEKP